MIQRMSAQLDTAHGKITTSRIC